MDRLSRFLAVGLCLVSAVLLAAACRPEPVVSPPPSAAGPDEAQIVVYVMSNGWHSAIAVPTAALPEGAIPEAADFPAADYLSFGWGDATYFPARDPTTAMALSAALQPTPAVLHLAGLTSLPGDVFPADEVVELRTTSAGLAALVAYLDAAFDRDGATRVQAREPGLHRFSLFYPATGEFHLFNTCNTWTARGLQAAGWPVRASGTVTAEDLMVQVRPLASAGE
jgi:uncharacterized protein (TIGR02117 family)